MTNYQQQQARLLEEYCDALAHNLQALPPAELDAKMVSLAQRLYQQAEAAEPPSTFAWRLEQRLAASSAPANLASADQAAAVSPTPPRRFPLQSWLMPRLATTAMLALLVIGAALLAGILSGRNPQYAGSGNGASASPTAQLPSIEQIAGYAKKTMESDQIRSFALTETERTILFQSPNRWRIESKGAGSASTQAPPDKQQTIEVSDGVTLSSYDSTSNVAYVGLVAALNNVKGSQHPLEGVLGDNDSLRWLSDGCYHPSVSGVDTVAGRPVYVINLGRYTCLALTTSFARVVWVDQQTYFVLRIITTDGITEATDVQYNQPIDNSVFTYTPPPGATFKSSGTDLTPEEVLLQKLMPQIFQAVAARLGISDEELKNELVKGSTIADIAKGKGVSEQDLKDAIIKTITPDLERQVKSGNLSQDEENKVIKAIQTTDLSRMMLLRSSFPTPASSAAPIPAGATPSAIGTRQP
ncbi:MAG: hypothetical protein DLM69_00495 [Candidatus Chloroheliales bacterium]|nr:MAG: hypothetical protein DLM69_00495 [Chloroflexota bacterium]